MTIKEYLQLLGINPSIKRAYEQVFSTEEGKLVLEDIKHKFHYYGDSESTDQNKVFREACERSVVCYILGLAKRFNDDNIELINNALRNNED